MGDADFQIKSKTDGDVTFVDIVGPIDERAQFGDLKSSTPKIAINLEKVNFLNSAGTRTWCVWVQRFRAPIEVTLLRCPVIMVRRFGSVRGFLPQQCQVQSFYVPYYSEQTGERRDFLAVRGSHYSGAKLDLPVLKDSKGNEMTMDIVPEIYFSFLK